MTQTPSNAAELTGQTFGRLTVLNLQGSRRHQRIWRCLCECGQETTVTSAHLRSGHTKSCGCLRAEMSKGKNNAAYRHGHTQGKFSATYHSWATMIQRCTNPDRESWRDYGGRGITVCSRWHDFDNFLADMGERPPGRTLDRRGVDGNYEPGNCRWATRDEQAHNKRPRDAKADQQALVLDALSVFPLKVSELASVTALHPELVRKAIRVLRRQDAVHVERVAGTPGSRGRMYLCTLAGGLHGN